MVKTMISAPVNALWEGEVTHQYHHSLFLPTLRLPLALQGAASVIHQPVIAPRHLALPSRLHHRQFLLSQHSCSARQTRGLSCGQYLINEPLLPHTSLSLTSRGHAVNHHLRLLAQSPACSSLPSTILLAETAESDRARRMTASPSFYLDEPYAPAAPCAIIVHTT